jgi:predicted small lipoprotein YifL
MFAVLAFVLTGCGVKSALEQPQPARLAEPDAAGTSSTAKETSRVETGRSFNLLPPENPVEWEKDKPKKNRAATKAGSKSTVPDKPFILDSLL